MLIPSDLKKWLKMRRPDCVHSSVILSYIEALEEDVGSKIAEIARLEKRIHQLESAQPKWISVEERLPDEEVLAANFAPGTYGYKEYIIGYVFQPRPAEPGGCYAENEHEILRDVTHWMPLPSAPEEV